MLRKKGRIGTDSREERGTYRVCASQAEKVETRTICHATPVNCLTDLIDNWQLDPSKVVMETSAPDDRRDPATPEVQLANRM